MGGSDSERGTVQMPRGANVGDTEPQLRTIVPASTAEVATSAPPAMPPEFRYTPKVEIARGGMGRVVEATDTLLGRDVAVKEALSLEPDALRRFQRETKITARLEHPSIVPVHDAGTSPTGAPFYVMRKISGQPLEDLIRVQESLGERLALLPHIVAAAQALAHAHERGIVHRDIKPSNILVGDLGETMVIDWGLAKEIDEPDEEGSTPHEDLDAIKTRAGIVFGTPGFMSPEQLRGARVDEKADVYALGATLYHLLARRPPHHAKTAEEMMQAAVAGPPQSLRELEPGVPPELATVVDKALANDPVARYQDARSFAEDLQRFLTGKLLASHHYSTREKIVRFVRKNRASVAVTAAAVAALAIGSWIAIGRIVDERDRADVQAGLAIEQRRVAEEERATALDNLAQATVAQARTDADSDPTRAVAMVKPLASSTHWREARAIAAAARAHGVAFGLDGSPHTISLELSRDGLRALAGGDDGQVRIYDLPHRTARVVVDAKEPAVARFADGERTIVLYHERHIAIVEPQDATRRDVTAPTPIIKLEVSGPIAYWNDTDGAVWHLDLAAGSPQRMSLDETVAAVAPSPDGRWIALAGSQHLLLLDRTQPALPPQAFGDGSTREIAWSDDGNHVVALIDDQMVDIELTPSPTLMHRQTVGSRYAIAWNAGRTFTAGPTGIVIASRDESGKGRVGGDYTLGIRAVPGGGVVSGGPNGTLVVLSEDGDQTLTSPLPLTKLAASARSPWVVAAAAGHVLVWNLEDLAPRHIVQLAPTGAAFVGPDALVATFVDTPALWFDLRTGKARPLGMIPGISAVVPSPDHDRAVVIDGTHRAHVVPEVGDPVELDGEVEIAAFLDDKRLAFATAAGAVQLDSRTLAHRSAGVAALATGGSEWIAAAFHDRTLWRANVRGTEATTTVASPPARNAFAVAHDGTVVYAIDRELHAWSVDGAARTLAKLSDAVVGVALPDEVTAVAVLRDGATALVDLRNGQTTMRTERIAPRATLGTGELVVSLATNGTIDLVDPLADKRWSLTAPKGMVFTDAQLSPNDARVLAITPTGLLVWSLGLPHGPDATAAWLAAMTNAVADQGPAAPLSFH